MADEPKPTPVETPPPEPPTPEELQAQHEELRADHEELRVDHEALLSVHPAGDLITRTSEGSKIVHEIIGSFIRARDYAEANGHGNVSATMVRIIRDLEVLHVLPDEAWAPPEEPKEEPKPEEPPAATTVDTYSH